MDTVFMLHLRSYGFFHSGRERLRVQVLKRCWEFIPGSTLYGALSAALIRLDGIDPVPPGEGTSGYHTLLQAVREGKIRFTPLLPAEKAIETAVDYCREAMLLQVALYGDKEPETWAQEQGVEQKLTAKRALFYATPHAPLGRATMQIHGDQLFALASHQPQQDYYGFVFAAEELGDLLRRGLRPFPLIPVGGKGKFSTAEAEVWNTADMGSFRRDLVNALGTQKKWVRLLTPMALEDGTNWLFDEAEELVMPRLRRYRVWRTGTYYKHAKDTFDSYGLERGLCETEEDSWLPGGQESEAVTAVPERSRFRLPAGQEITEKLVNKFVEGSGHRDWAYLGWGQVIVEC